MGVYFKSSRGSVRTPNQSGESCPEGKTCVICQMPRSNCSAPMAFRSAHCRHTPIYCRVPVGWGFPRLLALWCRKLGMSAYTAHALPIHCRCTPVRSGWAWLAWCDRSPAHPILYQNMRFVTHNSCLLFPLWEPISPTMFQGKQKRMGLEILLTLFHIGVVYNDQMTISWRFSWNVSIHCMNRLDSSRKLYPYHAIT